MRATSYTRLLDIDQKHCPPDYYRLLGVERFCVDSAKIDEAVYHRHDQLDKYSLHPDKRIRNDSQLLMNEVAKARITLTDPKERLDYDVMLCARENITHRSYYSDLRPSLSHNTTHDTSSHSDKQRDGSAKSSVTHEDAPAAHKIPRIFGAFVHRHLERPSLGRLSLYASALLVTGICISFILAVVNSSSSSRPPSTNEAVKPKTAVRHADRKNYKKSQFSR